MVGSYGGHKYEGCLERIGEDEPEDEGERVSALSAYLAQCLPKSFRPNSFLCMVETNLRMSRYHLTKMFLLEKQVIE